VIQFEGWPKTPRLSAGGVTITEKIDGTNACIIIMPEDRPLDEVREAGEFTNVIGAVYDSKISKVFLLGAQSRKRLIHQSDDNAGFAAWVGNNLWDLYDLLGPGRHFGEWWGQGIQRRYGMDRKVFSLFNTHKWGKVAAERGDWFDLARNINMTMVPTLYQGKFSDGAIETSLSILRHNGSMAAAEWGLHSQKAEGVIIRHSSLGGNLKAFIENDEVPKSVFEKAYQDNKAAMDRLADTPSLPVQKARQILEATDSVWD
jgi:hypothetical protein